jgi:prepilin-type N-terminal cleavage/methylation domain-containing protein
VPWWQKKMKKAFTLIELVVAVALLAMVFLFAGTIFKVSINAYRTSVANAEIMQKLRAITDQLNADFKGVILTVGGKVAFDFENSDIDGQTVSVRSDCIAVFANGDFQSTRQYPSTSGDKTVVGNVAIIYYGLADVNTTDPREKILVRRQTILTSDTGLTEDFSFGGQTEYYKSSLSELIVDGTFDVNKMMVRRSLDPTEPNDLVNYMAKGVDDFTIQYVGWEENPPEIKKFNEWRPENKDVNDWPKYLSPLAFKFTFTLYDSKGVIKNGRTFTHIVYLGN